MRLRPQSLNADEAFRPLRDLMPDTEDAAEQHN